MSEYSSMTDRQSPQNYKVLQVIKPSVLSPYFIGKRFNPSENYKPLSQIRLEEKKSELSKQLNNIGVYAMDLLQDYHKIIYQC